MAGKTKQELHVVCGKTILVTGRFPRIARIRAEQFDMLTNPEEFIAELRKTVRADIFTFLQPYWDTTPHHKYRLEWYDLAVLKFESYDSWWKNQLNDKTRNMIRKASKKGVELRPSDCDDEFVKGIKEIYDESPIRQGKPFWHYGKDLETLKEAHRTFYDRSKFVGAYFEGKLIGFIKMVYHEKSVGLMQIISMYKHRDKAPTNALLAKAVEMCAADGRLSLQYGMWSRRGFGEFKKHHCFERVKVPRFYVPLTFRGKLALSAHLHRKLIDFLPEGLVDWLAQVRGRWYNKKSPAGAA